MVPQAVMEEVYLNTMGAKDIILEMHNSPDLGNCFFSDNFLTKMKSIKPRKTEDLNAMQNNNVANLNLIFGNILMSHLKSFISAKKAAC